MNPANGEKLKSVRLKSNLNQSQLANIIDCYPHQVCMWESGKTELSDKRLGYFLDVLRSTQDKIVA